MKRNSLPTVMRRKFVIPYIRALPDRISHTPIKVTQNVKPSHKLTNPNNYANSNYFISSVIRNDWHV